MFICSRLGIRRISLGSRLDCERMSICSWLGDGRTAFSIDGRGLGRRWPSGPCVNEAKGGVPGPEPPSSRP
jgi:hypothetical protein